MLIDIVVTMSWGPMLIVIVMSCVITWLATVPGLKANFRSCLGFASSWATAGRARASARGRMRRLDMSLLEVGAVTGAQGVRIIRNRRREGQRQTLEAR